MKLAAPSVTGGGRERVEWERRWWADGWGGGRCGCHVWDETGSEGEMRERERSRMGAESECKRRCCEAGEAFSLGPTCRRAWEVRWKLDGSSCEECREAVLDRWVRRRPAVRR